MTNTFTVSSVEYASATSHSFPIIYEAEYLPSAVPYSPNTQQITCKSDVNIIHNNGTGIKEF